MMTDRSENIILARSSELNERDGNNVGRPNDVSASLIDFVFLSPTFLSHLKRLGRGKKGGPPNPLYVRLIYR